MHAKLATRLVLLAALAMAVPAAAQITITTDADTYSMGDIVTITIHNAGPDTEELLSEPIFAVIHQDTGDCLFGCSGLPVITPVAPGETIVRTWDTGWLPDPEGQYLLTLAVNSDHPDSVTEAEYELLAVVPTDDVSWDQVRGMYR